MAYDDTHCPCGCRKMTQTLLCDACAQQVSPSTDWQLYADEKLSVGTRRAAAIRLLAVARKRRAAPALALGFNA
jgi:hypothetical protein